MGLKINQINLNQSNIKEWNWKKNQLNKYKKTTQANPGKFFKLITWIMRPE
jgi:hypothetical protein